MAIKCIGILTSGGDAPGMNAAIRAVTRTAIYNGYQVKGIMRGYHGLVTNEIVEFKSQSVSNIIQKRKYFLAWPIKVRHHNSFAPCRACRPYTVL